MPWSWAGRGWSFRTTALGERGSDFLTKVNEILSGTSGRVFNVNTYREAYIWLYGSAQGVIHHIFAKAQDLSKWFASRGINVNFPLFLQDLDPAKHAWLTNTFGWDARWVEFMDNNKYATVTEIFQFARQLCSEAGIPCPF